MDFGSSAKQFRHRQHVVPRWDGEGQSTARLWICIGVFACLLSGAATGQEQEGSLWSLQPLSSPGLPQVERAAWALNDLDRFVLQRQEAGRMLPVPMAEPSTLVRRLYFDLLGLPPTPEDVHSFVAEASRDSQSAVCKLVDRLLAAPEFGERWGRHWLDLVRFAESNGGDRNVIFPHAWRYRDYVVASFNQDKPYDQFVREQLAGDLLPAETAQQRDEQRIATGMLTLGAKLFMETDAERFRMDAVDDQIDVVGQAILGLTVSCARCHDHKFDPIPTEDYYALAGIFRSTFLMYGTGAPAGNEYGHDRPLQPLGEDGERLHGPATAWQKQVADKTAERNKARSDRYRVVRQQQAHENQLKTASGELADRLRVEIGKMAAEIADWDAKIKRLDAELQAITDRPPPMPDYAMAVRDDDKIEDCPICVSGSSQQRGPSVPRGVLSAVSAVPAPRIDGSSSGRRELASWITDRQHPLTARVYVNRVWQHLFGEGLVPSVNNFGVQGERPSHPELLDRLARDFMDQGWSAKWLIRRLATSRVYQLSSRISGNAAAVALDPGNRYRWRQNPRRLEAEALRDAVLSVSGNLDSRSPGSSVVARLNQLELNDNVRLTDEQLNAPRRSVYLPIARFQMPEMLQTFDCPDPSLAVGSRSSATTASQQLFFLNSRWLVEQSEAAARRLLTDRDTDAARIQLACQRFFAREADPYEIEAVLDYLAAELASASSEVASPDIRLRAWTRLCQAWMASVEFRTIE